MGYDFGGDPTPNRRDRHSRTVHRLSSDPKLMHRDRRPWVIPRSADVQAAPPITAGIPGVDMAWAASMFSPEGIVQQQQKKASAALASDVATAPLTQAATTNTTDAGTGQGAVDSLDLGGLTVDELSAMLDYISAQTGLTVEQLSQQAGVLGDAARQMMVAIQQQYVEGVRSAEANAAQRGLGHSGIFARNVGRVGEARTLQEGKVRGDAEKKLADLQLALSSLTSQNQLQAANAGSDILRSNLPAGEQAALQNRLSDLNLGAIPNIDLSQIANQAAGFSLV